MRPSALNTSFTGGGPLAEQDLRAFLTKLERLGELKHYRRPVSARYEIARLIQQHDGGPALRFSRVQGHEFEVVANLCSSRARIALALGIKEGQFITRVTQALRRLGELRLTKRPPIHESTEENPNLKRLPILTHFERDGGPYITAGIVIAKDLQGRYNASFHRLMLLSRRRLAIRLVPRHLHQMYSEAERNDKPLEVAVALGLHPAVSMAAATSPPYGVNELRLAASLLGGRLEVAKCKTVDLVVPARAELVLEGHLLPHERVKEGPFCDILGLYDSVRLEPVLEVSCLTSRSNALYQALLPGGLEHQLLMGMPQEPKLFEALNRVVEVKGVHLTPGGCCWLHAVISIVKRSPGDGRRAIRAAFRAHPSLKHVVVVDEDVEIHNPREVEWAIATRLRADQGLICFTDSKGSSLDPTKRRGSWAKLGVDATKDLRAPQRFQRARIPAPKKGGGCT